MFSETNNAAGDGYWGEKKEPKTADSLEVILRLTLILIYFCGHGAESRMSVALAVR